MRRRAKEEDLGRITQQMIVNVWVSGMTERKELKCEIIIILPEIMPTSLTTRERLLTSIDFNFTFVYWGFQHHRILEYS